MKTIIAAVALVIALPAAANAQAAQPGHADHHADHKGMDHGKEHKDCCKHKNADGTPMDCCKPGKDGKMAACCEKHAEKHDAHAGHKQH